MVIEICVSWNTLDFILYVEDYDQDDHDFMATVGWVELDAGRLTDSPLDRLMGDVKRLVEERSDRLFELIADDNRCMDTISLAIGEHKTMEHQSALNERWDIERRFDNY